MGQSKVNAANYKSTASSDDGRFKTSISGNVMQFRNLRTGKIHDKKRFYKELKRNENYVPLASWFIEKDTKDSISANYLVTYGFEEMIPVEIELDKMTLGKTVDFKKDSFIDSKDFEKYDKTKPTFLALWYIACPGCINEMPNLNILKSKYEDKINFISLTFEKKEDVEVFLTKQNFNLSHTIDNEIVDSLGEFSYPRVFLLDRDQKIKWSTGGVLETEIEGYDRILKHLINGGLFSRFYY
jgi:thiol-disulfide isomerase/thioredoxin